MRVQLTLFRGLIQVIWLFIKDIFLTFGISKLAIASMLQISLSSMISFFNWVNLTFLIDFKIEGKLFSTHC